MAVSRPEPGPFTSTSTLRTPCSMARRAHGLGRHLGGERRALAGALEADVAGRRPGEDVALLVGDADDRVVERALDVRHAVGDVLALALAGPATAGLGLRHYFLTFFLPATVFFGPLRVRALVWVRWPRTGQALAVAEALPAADLHLALDVLLDVAAQVALDLEVVVDVVRGSR